jgi:hypothetical protein
VNNNVNDVAMTVLPDAPIDPATGLPVPTIAVATAGGVSVIKDDGTVVSDSALFFAGHSTVNNCHIFGEKLYVTSWNGLNQNNLGVLDIRTLVELYRYTAFPSLYTSPTPFNDQNLTELSYGSGQLFIGTGNFGGLTPKGVGVIAEDISAPTKGMSALLTSTYNTGWMNGDIKGAFLSDTDDTDLVGSGELVTNGTFDTDTDWAKGTGWTISSGVANHAVGVGSSLDQAIGFVAGTAYVIEIEATASGGSWALQFTGGATNTIGSSLGTGTFTLTGVAASGNNNLRIFAGSATDLTIDNVSVKLADADRSFNNRGLIVNGTVTRSPVESGADLVGYSGFSASNYLEQPYNSALDFGTGDFAVMGWFKENTLDSLAYLFARDSFSSSENYMAYVQSGQLTFKLDDDVSNYLVQVSGASVAGQWQHFVGVKNGDTAYVYINGVQRASLDVSAMGSLTNTSAYLRFGLSASNTSPLDLGSLALWRISATAPTAEQVRKIYEDEKFLFQDGAQATLFGASDAVTALAHDPVTDLLHVGTSAGRSVFSGLRRVSNTTTAVGTAISASNGLVVEE